jgi:hypothetical protein
MSRPSQRGFVAVEWVAATSVLLLPIVVLVATLPAWAERRHTATVAAREAARVLARDWPAGDPVAAARVAREVAADHGVDAADVEVRSDGTAKDRAGSVRVEVEVVMPAIAVGTIRAGAWRYTAVAVRRVDDYRSRS